MILGCIVILLDIGEYWWMYFGWLPLVGILRYWALIFAFHSPSIIDTNRLYYSALNQLNQPGSWTPTICYPIKNESFKLPGEFPSASLVTHLQEFRYGSMGISVLNGGSLFDREKRGFTTRTRSGQATLCLESPADPRHLVQRGQGMVNKRKLVVLSWCILML